MALCYPDDPLGPALLGAMVRSSTLAGKVSDDVATMREAASGIEPRLLQ